MAVLPVSGLLMMNHYARDTMEMIRTLFFATLLALPLCYLTYMSAKLEKRMSRDLLIKILAISPFITGMVLAFAFYMTGKTSMKVQSVVLWICILVGIVYIRQSLRKGDEKDEAVEQAPATVTADPETVFASSGEKTYTYNKFVFYVWMIICGLCPTVLIITFHQIGAFATARKENFDSILYAALMAFCTPSLYVFFASRHKIIVDSRGVTQQTLFRSTKIFWDDILEVKRKCYFCTLGFHSLKTDLSHYPCLDIEIRSQTNKIPIFCYLDGFETIEGKLKSMGHLRDDDNNAS